MGSKRDAGTHPGRLRTCGLPGIGRPGVFRAPECYRLSNRFGLARPPPRCRTATGGLPRASGQGAPQMRTRCRSLPPSTANDDHHSVRLGLRESGGEGHPLHAGTGRPAVAHALRCSGRGRRGHEHDADGTENRNGNREGQRSSTTPSLDRRVAATPPGTKHVRRRESSHCVTGCLILTPRRMPVAVPFLRGGRALNRRTRASGSPRRWQRRRPPRRVADPLRPRAAADGWPQARAGR